MGQCDFNIQWKNVKYVNMYVHEYKLWTKVWDFIIPADDGNAAKLSVELISPNYIKLHTEILW